MPSFYATFRFVSAVVVTVAAAIAHADLGFPDYVKFPPQIVISAD